MKDLRLMLLGPYQQAVCLSLEKEIYEMRLNMKLQMECLKESIPRGCCLAHSLFSTVRIPLPTLN